MATIGVPPGFVSSAEDQQTERAQETRDRELYILPEVCVTLGKLTPAERRRVIVWLIDKFSIRL